MCVCYLNISLLIFSFHFLYIFFHNLCIIVITGPHQQLLPFSSSLRDYCCVMNMLPPINENSFQDHVKAVKNAGQHAAEKKNVKGC